MRAASSLRCLAQLCFSLCHRVCAAKDASQCSDEMHALPCVQFATVLSEFDDCLPNRSSSFLPFFFSLFYVRKIIHVMAQP